MAAQVLGVLTVLVALLLKPILKETNALAIVFLFFACGALISVLQRKPWTVELSAADMGDFATHPTFIKSNMMLSAIWIPIFGWFCHSELARAFAGLPVGAYDLWKYHHCDRSKNAHE